MLILKNPDPGETRIIYFATLSQHLSAEFCSANNQRAYHSTLVGEDFQRTGSAMIRQMVCRGCVKLATATTTL